MCNINRQQRRKHMTPVQKQILSPSYPNGINSGLTSMGPVDWAFVLLKTWGLPSSNYSWQIRRKKHGYVMIWFISYTHQTQAIGKARKQHARGSSEPAFTHISNHPLFASERPLKFLPRLEFPGSELLCFYLSFSSAPGLSRFLRAQERSQDQGSWEEKAGLSP